jgi:hypothetical protein
MLLDVFVLAHSLIPFEGVIQDNTLVFLFFAMAYLSNFTDHHQVREGKDGNSFMHKIKLLRFTAFQKGRNVGAARETGPPSYPSAPVSRVWGSDNHR